jgi:hypothetical protein
VFRRFLSSDSSVIPENRALINIQKFLKEFLKIPTKLTKQEKLTSSRRSRRTPRIQHPIRQLSLFHIPVVRVVWNGQIVGH